MPKSETSLLQIALKKLHDWMKRNGLIVSAKNIGDGSSSAAENQQERDSTKAVDSDSTSSSQFVSTIIKKVETVLTADWKTVDYSHLADMRRHSTIGKPAKVRCTLSEVSDVKPCYEISGGVDTLSMVIADEFGDTMTVAPIVSEPLLRRVLDVSRSGQMLDFCGTIVPAKPRREKADAPDYSFFLASIEQADQPLQIVRANAVETDKADQLVATLVGVDNGIFDYIKKNVIDIIGIKGLDKSPVLDVCLDLAIYQALSDGYDTKRSLSLKIHSLVIGPPAVGKKLITEAIRILNPVVTEAHSGKVTVAGLSGTATKRDGSWTSTPGLIPQAHRGTTIIQDFHHARRKEDLMGVFSLVMEDGRVIDSSAAKKTHLALTSLHLDLNRLSQVSPSSVPEASPSANLLGDLGITMNVLSRFDFIAEIPRDTERQIEIALAMHSGELKTSAFAGETNIDPRIRELRVLVAYLRDKHSEVTIPDALAKDYIRQKQEELLELNRDKLAELNILGDFQTRLANSVQKLTFAVTRANGRDIATESDVDEAFRFIDSKMKFLRTLEDFKVPTSWGSAKQERIRKRREFIVERFAGLETTATEIHKVVIAEHDAGIGERTVRRDLEDIAVQTRHGYFRVSEMVKGTTKQSDTLSN